MAGVRKKRKVSSPNGRSATRGVGAAECNENVLPKLISDGDQLLTGHRTLARTCIFQQDNAPAHTAVMNKALLNDFLPDRWMQDSESGLACMPS